jgi:sugar O-acyltransferase (sialic acid O-acetyltransferase NeuD family)
MNSILIFGTGAIAEIAHYCFSHQSDREIEGFIVDDEYLGDDSLFGLPIIPFSKIKENFPPARFDIFVGMGYSKMNSNRAKAFKRIKDLGYTCPTFLSPDCNCYTTEIGENCLILEDNTIQPFVNIGNNVTLWSGNHIGHHTTIHENAYITSHVVISGSCSIGENTFIGVNASLRDNINIGKSCMIGMGASVTKHLTDGQVLRSAKSEVLEILSSQLKGM